MHTIDLTAVARKIIIISLIANFIFFLALVLIIVLHVHIPEVTLSPLAVSRLSSYFSIGSLSALALPTFPSIGGGI